MVANDCDWDDQEFTHVSGTLGGGVGYMCALDGCRQQVHVEGTTAAAHRWVATLRSGDAVFCSACLASESGCQSDTSGSICAPSPTLLLLVLTVARLLNGFAT